MGERKFRNFSSGSQPDFQAVFKSTDCLCARALAFEPLFLVKNEYWDRDGGRRSTTLLKGAKYGHMLRDTKNNLGQCPRYTPLETIPCSLERQPAPPDFLPYTHPPTKPFLARFASLASSLTQETSPPQHSGRTPPYAM